MVRLTETAIDTATAYDLINATFSGSVVIHYAVVKKLAGGSGATACIEYKIQGDTVQELETISAELLQRFELEDTVLIRRTGCVAVGEIISLIAASSPNSDDAFEACKYGISRMKKMTTIIKTEKYSGSI